MVFADIHNHSLFGCDDGAKTENEMRQMVDASYKDGVRYICFSPHYNPGYFGYNKEKSQEAYNKICEYVKTEYPDLKIAIGNELRYNAGCVEWINRGDCRKMNNSRYVLMDFQNNESSKSLIEEALESLLRAGYLPILAHVERYPAIRGDRKFYKYYKDRGVIIQIDAGALFKDFGLMAYLEVNKLLKQKIVDIVSSDGHDLKKRPVEISKAYQFISKKYGEEYANKLCYKNAVMLIFND